MMTHSLKDTKLIIINDTIVFIYSLNLIRHLTRKTQCNVYYGNINLFSICFILSHQKTRHSNLFANTEKIRLYVEFMTHLKLSTVHLFFYFVKPFQNKRNWIVSTKQTLMTNQQPNKYLYLILIKMKRFMKTALVYIFFNRKTFDSTTLVGKFLL